MPIRIKRVYEKPEEDDGVRLLVDRLWPRGLTKEVASIDLWLKQLSPSTELRRWYNHDPAKWQEFKRRYFAELSSNPEAVSVLLEQVGAKPTTFLFSSKETKLNNAVALKEYVLSLQ
jgi:uncharacterized protein YeaO (DUF488 family)